MAVHPDLEDQKRKFSLLKDFAWIPTNFASTDPCLVRGALLQLARSNRLSPLLHCFFPRRVAVLEVHREWREVSSINDHVSPRGGPAIASRCSRSQTISAAARSANRFLPVYQSAVGDQ